MTVLYRHFDAKGALLYVGISNSVLVRLNQHKLHSRWFDDISKVTIERFPSRDAARKAEAKAIRQERPKYNIQFRNSKPPEAKPRKLRQTTSSPIEGLMTLDDIVATFRCTTRAWFTRRIHDGSFPPHVAETLDGEQLWRGEDYNSWLRGKP